MSLMVELTYWHGEWSDTPFGSEHMHMRGQKHIRIRHGRDDIFFGKYILGNLTFLYKVPFPATLFCFWLLVLILPTYVNTQWNQEMYWEYMASWGGVAPGVLSEARHERCNTFSMSHVFLIHVEIPIYDLFCLSSKYLYRLLCIF